MPIDVLNFLQMLNEDVSMNIRRIPDPIDFSGGGRIDHPKYIDPHKDDPNMQDSKAGEEATGAKKSLNKHQVAHIATGMALMHALTGDHHEISKHHFSDEEVQKHIDDGYLPKGHEHGPALIRHILGAQKHFSTRSPSHDTHQPIIGGSDQHEFKITLNHPGQNGKDVTVKRNKDGAEFHIDLATFNAKKTSLGTEELGELGGSKFDDMKNHFADFNPETGKFEREGKPYGTLGVKALSGLSDEDREKVLRAHSQAYIDEVNSRHGHQDDFIMSDAGHMFEMQPGSHSHSSGQFIPVSQIASGVRAQTRLGRSPFSLQVGNRGMKAGGEQYHKQHLDLNNPKSIIEFFRTVKKNKKK